MPICLNIKHQLLKYSKRPLKILCSQKQNEQTNQQKPEKYKSEGMDAVKKSWIKFQKHEYCRLKKSENW